MLSGGVSRICRDALINMVEPLINNVTKTPVIQDALKKPERDKQRKAANQQKKKSNKKDPKRIIDTYA